jgi:hypothetical protein
MKFPDSGGPKEVEIAADMIRNHYAMVMNGSQGTSVAVRFESLRDAIATALVDANLQVSVLGEIIRRNVPHHDPSTANVSTTYQIVMGGLDYKKLLEFVTGVTEKQVCDCGATELPIPAHRAGCAAKKDA